MTKFSIFVSQIIDTFRAASGDLDTTFSGDGKIIQSFGGTEHVGYDVAVQADGKVVVVG